MSPPKPIEDSKPFGEMVKSRRLAKHMGIQQVADAMAVSANLIYAIERGRIPSGSNMVNLIKVLEISPDEFVSTIGWWEEDLLPPGKAAKIAALFQQMVEEVMS